MKDFKNDKTIPSAIKKPYQGQKEVFPLDKTDSYCLGFSSFPDKRPCLYSWSKKDSILLTSFVSYVPEGKESFVKFNIGIHYKNSYGSWTGTVYTIEQFKVSSDQKEFSSTMKSSKTLSAFMRALKLFPDHEKMEHLLASLDSSRQR